MDEDDAMPAEDDQDALSADSTPSAGSPADSTPSPDSPTDADVLDLDSLIQRIGPTMLPPLEKVGAEFALGAGFSIPNPVSEAAARMAGELSGIHRVQKIIAESLAPTLAVERALAGSMGAIQRFYAEQNPSMTSQIQNLASSLSRAYQFRAGINLMGAAATSLFSALPPTFRHTIVDQLCRIRDLLEAADADAFERGFYAVALRTRQAILEDPDSRPEVDHFTRAWLGIRGVTMHVLDAVVEALLEDDWHETSLSDDELRVHLRRRVTQHHEVLRPITDRQLNRQKVMSLSTPAGMEDMTIEQLIPHPRMVEDEAFHRLGYWQDDRLNHLFGKLDPASVAITTAYGQNAGTWEQAAVAAGYPPQQGEAVRRRLKNLRNEDRRRGGLILPTNDGRWSR